MADIRFFSHAGALSLAEILSLSGARLMREEADTSRAFSDVASLEAATENDISFLDNIKYKESFKTSRAGACFAREKETSIAPASMQVLITEDPYRAFALIAQHFYPAAAVSGIISAHAHIDDSAILGTNCTIEAGAIIGKCVELGAHCHIGAGAVIHDGVAIGEHSSIGANSTLSHCIIGSHVIIHRGVHIGQDGFGFAMSAKGHVKVPQLGRVIIGDNVEIGSGTCIDRGAGPDTIIGAGAKIDNLVQIGHNVHIGKNAIIVSQVGISGSSHIGDGAILAGQVGIAGHLKIGPGARLAAQSGVISDIPAGAAYGGTPAVPIKDWHRQTVILGKLVKAKGVKNDNG